MNFKIISILLLLIILPYSLSAYGGRCTGHAGYCRTSKECARLGKISIAGFCPQDPNYILCCY